MNSFVLEANKVHTIYRFGVNIIFLSSEMLVS